MLFTTMQALQRANEVAGQHWFSQSAMRFFRTEIESDIMTMRDGRQFFVTSEQFVGSDGVADERRYSIRWVGADGQVGTFGKFMEYDSKAHALSVLADMHRNSSFPHPT